MQGGVCTPCPVDTFKEGVSNGGACESCLSVGAVSTCGETGVPARQGCVSRCVIAVGGTGEDSSSGGCTLVARKTGVWVFAMPPPGASGMQVPLKARHGSRYSMATRSTGTQSSGATLLALTC
eukprot:3747993-Rhodomonas_salina.1